MAVITYKCPNCGGDLRFDPESQKHRCEYCRSLFTQEELEQIIGQRDADALGASGQVVGAAQTQVPGQAVGAAQEQVLGQAGVPDPEQASDQGQSGGAEAAVMYSCPNCGAEIVTDENTAATFCYYCHNPVVLAGRMQGDYHPDYVLPFAVNREKALDIFEKWIGKKRYIPKAFYSKEQIEKMIGIYFPYWLYSCQVEGRLDAEGIKRKVWTAGNTQYTQTEKYDVSREGQMQVDHVTRNALSKANRKLVEGVLPFDMEKLEPFSMSYLSGFMAEKRDMEEDQFRYEVQQEVKSFAENALQSGAAGYDSLQVRQKRAELKGENWKYALMPVWTLTYRDPKRDKVYYFACNGQTGKVCGELPVDSGRLAALFASIFVPVFLVLMIVGYLL